MSTHAQHVCQKAKEGGGQYLFPSLDLTIISKRRVRAKQPWIGVTTILPYDALRLLFARRPRLLERIAGPQELFPAVRVPRLESGLVDADHVARVGHTWGACAGGGLGDG